MNICEASSKKIKAAIITIGCRLNQADSGLVASRLEAAGYEIYRSPDESNPPSVIVVNTCAVTAAASQKSRQTIRALRKKFPSAKIIAAGCDPEVDKDLWLKENCADIVIGNEDKKRIAEIIIASFAPPTPKQSPERHPLSFKENAIAAFPFRSRAYLKIQEGCNANCTYCIVPRARGQERSRNIDEIFREFRAMLSKGFREIALTGVNICAFRHGDYGLSQLLRELADEPGDFRIRLSSTEPDAEIGRIIELIRDNSKICRFLHLPLQHGSDEILERMGRKYRTRDFAEFAESAARQIPGIHLGTDIITGFPGETEYLFKKSFEFIESLPLANLHIFRFSPRKGTPAANFANQVPQRVARERAEKLAELEKKLAARFIESQIGETLPVLIEKTGKHSSGWSDNYIKVFSISPGIEKGAIAKIRIVSKHDASSLDGFLEERRV